MGSRAELPSALEADAALLGDAQLATARLAEADMAVVRGSSSANQGAALLGQSTMPSRAGWEELEKPEQPAAGDVTATSGQDGLGGAAGDAEPHSVTTWTPVVQVRAAAASTGHTSSASTGGY